MQRLYGDCGPKTACADENRRSDEVNSHRPWLHGHFGRSSHLETFLTRIVLLYSLD